MLDLMDPYAGELFIQLVCLSSLRGTYMLSLKTFVRVSTWVHTDIVLLQLHLQLPLSVLSVLWVLSVRCVLCVHHWAYLSPVGSVARFMMVMYTSIRDAM